jgi:hypothetical protein
MRSASATITGALCTPLGHHAHAADDLRHRAAAPELLADMAVAAERAGAGGDEVAHAGETGKGFCLAAQRHPKARDLAEAARDHGGAGIVAGAHAVADAAGYGDHVLQCTGQLAADHIVVAVDAEQSRAEQCLKVLQQRRIFHCQHAGGCLAAQYLHGQVRAAERANRMTRQFGANDLAHAQGARLLEALGQADHRHPGAQVFARHAQHAAETLCRHRHHQHIGALQRAADVGLRLEAVG